MIILANTEKKKNVVFINELFNRTHLLNKHHSLQTLLHPTQQLVDDVGGLDNLKVLLELNLAVAKEVKPFTPLKMDFTHLSPENALLLEDWSKERPESLDVSDWVRNSKEFYVKSSPSDVIVHIGESDVVLSQGFRKLESTSIKEVMLELVYSQFTYFEIHNPSTVNPVIGDYEVTVAKAFEVGLG